MLQKSVETTDVECLDSSLESERGFTPACRVDIIDEIFPTLDTCNASSSQSPQDEQNSTEIIKCFNNQACLHRKTNISEWWDNQAETNLRRVANGALASPVSQASVKKFFRV